MIHSFDTEIAKRFGVGAALLLNNIYFWTEKNRANGTNIHDGRPWTYNSKRAFVELFPYFTARQIDYALSKLKEDGVIITGNFNKAPYDQTLWYAITDFGYSILQNCEMDKTNLWNGLHKNVQPIPDSKPNKKPNNKPNKSKAFVPPTLEDIKDYCKQRNNDVDPKKFYDYFSASDWIDSKGKPVLNWKQKVITWEGTRKDGENNASNTGGYATETGRVGHYL